MTKNQIEFANYVEGSRHNRAGEEEVNRHNLATEVETHRNNTVQEYWTGFNATETQRSNQAKEVETSKHNRATEKQAKYELKETKKHNRATEKQAKKDLAERKRAAKDTVAATKYSADRGKEGRVESAAISADASKYAANTSANAAITAANINAAAQKEVQGMRNLSAKELKLLDVEIANKNNATQKAIEASKERHQRSENQKDRDATKAIQAMELAWKGIQNAADRAIKNKEVNVQEFRAKIEDFKAQAEAAYKKGYLTLQEKRSLINGSDKLLQGISSGQKVLGD